MAGKAPVKKFKASRHSGVTIWDNGENGYGFTIDKPTYKNESGVWVESSFWQTDLPSIQEAIRRALDWAYANTAQEK